MVLLRTLLLAPLQGGSLLLLACLCCGYSVLGRKGGSVPLLSRPGSDAVTYRSVPVGVAKKLMEAGHQYLDVRTEENFKAGHARGAVNVPYLHSTLDGLTKSPDFLAEVAARFAKPDNILGCGSGGRSKKATFDLQTAEYMVTDIDGGFAAWRHSGLPTEAPQLQQE